MKLCGWGRFFILFFHSIFDVGRSMFDVQFFPEIEPPLPLGGYVPRQDCFCFFHSTFDVGRSMFDVRFLLAREAIRFQFG